MQNATWMPITGQAGHTRAGVCMGSPDVWTAGSIDPYPVKETFRGETAWEGVVEVLEIKGHPKASRVYAWSHLDKEDDSDERFVAVLGVPPVDSPLRAVQVSIVADAKKAK